MKPLQVHAVESSYTPGYPRFEEIEDWERLLATANARSFHPATLLFAGLLGGSLVVPSAAAADVQGPPLKSSNQEAAKVANAALAEVAETGSWFDDSATVKQTQDRSKNPPIEVPQIRISFGNSYVGVFDTTRAKKATIDLFAAYGVKLQPKYGFKKGGIEFEVDGYDPDKKIGFEIVGSDAPPGGFGGLPPKTGKDEATLLDVEESAELDALVAKGEETMFLTPVGAYPNMDGDQYTPLRAYLQSVIDYLEWLKGEGRL